MRVIGVASPVGTPIIDFVVGHGEHPDLTLWNAGYVAVRPLSANLVAGDITVVFLVRPSSKDDRPQRRRQRQFDPGVSARQPAQQRQRIAAYALVASPREILGTVCSPRTNAPGVWMLPEGGLDPHESPSEAVLREIYEETGQDVRLRRLLALQWITGLASLQTAPWRISTRCASFTAPAVTGPPRRSSTTMLGRLSTRPGSAAPGGAACPGPPGLAHCSPST